jgi:hypothetical protein
MTTANLTPKKALEAVKGGLTSAIYGGVSAVACGGMLALEHINYGSWMMVLVSGGGAAVGVYSIKAASGAQQVLGEVQSQRISLYSEDPHGQSVLHQ